MSDIEFEIDGKKVTGQPNSMVIQVADAAGIYIPRFCYHKHLSIAANCRMCLVEVEKAPKPMPACATPIMPGMKVFTKSPKAIAAQRAVMEFLLINHPLDCPICDQGGECELQDLSMGYGAPDSFYNEGKRSVKDENIGPLIATDMTRCIQCTRCVRFGVEIAGKPELGGIGRGEHTEIKTYIDKALQSEISGNVIDLCPVGALTSKPYRFTARAWELTQLPSISPHDCLGSHLNVHTRRGKVMRVVPREKATINETWLSDRDRFSYQGLYHPDRLQKPFVRVNGVLEETDWQTALEVAAKQLTTITKQQPNQLAALVSPNSTVEEFYSLQKLMRQLGSHNIDHRLRQVDFNDQDHMPSYPGLPLSLEALENQDVIVLIGSHIHKEQPLLGVRLRKAALSGKQILVMNMMDYAFNFAISGKVIAAPHQFVERLSQTLATDFNGTLSTDKKITFLLGAQAFNHPKASQIRKIVHQAAERLNANVGFLTEGANAAGAWLTGCIPHRDATGKTTQGYSHLELDDQNCKAYLLLNVDVNLDCANPTKLKQNLKKADFVLSMNCYMDEVSAQYADVILPIAPFTETSGTYINALGEWQSFAGVALPLGDSRPAWKVLRVLGTLLDLTTFEYGSSELILDEVRKVVNQSHQSYQIHDALPNQLSHSTLSRIGEIPLYAIDHLTRHAPALQAAQQVIEGDLETVAMNRNTAAKHHIVDGQMVGVKQIQTIKLPVKIDERVPDDAVFIAGGLPITSDLVELFGAIELVSL